jgi:hypothetical protein
MWGTLSDERSGVYFTVAARHSPAQSWDLSPMRFMTIFYCLNSETSLTWRARFLYLFPRKHGSSGIVPPTLGKNREWEVKWQTPIMKMNFSIPYLVL